MDTGQPPASVTDDRGRVFTLHLPWWRWLVPAGPWYWSVPVWRLRLLQTLSVLLLMASAALVAALLGWIRGVAWFFPAAAVLTVAQVLAERWAIGPLRGRLASDPRSCVRPGHCGACGYPLARLAKEPDGCTICPECGATWRRHEVAAPGMVPR